MQGLMPSIINIIAGISLFAAVNHWVMGRSSHISADDHFKFAVLAFISFLLAITLAIEYRVNTQTEFIELIRYQQIVVSLYYISLLVFVRQVTTIIEDKLFYLMVFVHGVFSVASLLRPYGLFLDGLHGIKIPEQGFLGYHAVALNPQYSSFGWSFILFSWLQFFYLEYYCLYHFKKTKLKEALYLSGILFLYYAGFAYDIYYFISHGLNTYFSFLSFPVLILMMSSHIAGAKQAKVFAGTEEKYRRLVEGVRDDYVVFSYLPCGFCEYISPSMEKLLGYKPDELLGERWKNVGALSGNIAKMLDQDLLMHLPEDGRVSGIEETVLSRKGEVVYFDISIQALKNSTGEVILIEGFARDITKERKTENQLLSLNNELEFHVEERTQALQTALEELRNEIDHRDTLEKQLRQAQKMESIGQLAGGVAHDFNNIMTAISGFAELAINESRQGIDIDEDLERILEVARRGSKLTEQLLGFARKQIAAPQSIKPDEALAKTLRLIPHLLESNIMIDVQFKGDAGYIRIDPIQFDQIVINLIVNARDAMPRGGEITIITQNLSAEDINREGRPFIPAGDYVSLSIMDTGMGIHSDVIKKIFDPFFTTKAVGKGSGLGLSVCYGVVKQCGGYIFVDSEPGFGSAFEVVFPLVGAPDFKKFESKTVVEQGDISGGNETILLVEDDPSVSMLTEKILLSAGYTVLLASNGIEALDLVEKSLENIDLLVTDFMMPKMDGHELINTVRLLLPDLAILCLSGYADGDLIEDLRGSGVLFLQKPYSPIQLARLVREALVKQPMKDKTKQTVF